MSRLLDLRDISQALPPVDMSGEGFSLRREVGRKLRLGSVVSVLLLRNLDGRLILSMPRLSCRRRRLKGLAGVYFAIMSMLRDFLMFDTLIRKRFIIVRGHLHLLRKYYLWDILLI